MMPASPGNSISQISRILASGCMRVFLLPSRLPIPYKEQSFNRLTPNLEELRRQIASNVLRSIPNAKGETIEMSKRTLSAVCVVAVIVGVLVCREALQAQKLKGKSRPAPTRQLMKGILQLNAGSLGAALKDAGPADDKAWEAAQTAAVVLNEASYILMDDGRCPDAVWAGAAKTLQEGSAAVMAALEKKDLEGSRAAAKTLMGACMACHKAHKPPKQ